MFALNIRNIDDRIVFDQVDICVCISNDYRVVFGVEFDTTDTDIRQSIDLGDAIYAVVVLVEIENSIGGRKVDLIPRLGYRIAQRVRQLVAPLSDRNLSQNGCYPMEQKNE